MTTMINFGKLLMVARSSHGLPDWDEECFFDYFNKFELVIAALPSVKRYSDYIHEITSPLCRLTRPEEHIKIMFSEGTFASFITNYKMDFIVCYNCGEYAEFRSDGLPVCNCNDCVGNRMFNELNNYIRHEIDIRMMKYMSNEEREELRRIYNMRYYKFRDGHW